MLTMPKLVAWLFPLCDVVFEAHFPVDPRRQLLRIWRGRQNVVVRFVEVAPQVSLGPVDAKGAYGQSACVKRGNGASPFEA